MKTLTEFAGIQLKKAAEIKSQHTAAGKPSEEFPQALGEALKLEGDRLNWLISALEAVGNKFGDLKRAVIFTLSEGEKPPGKSVQKGEHYFIVEYFPSLKSAQPVKHHHADRNEGKGKRRRKDNRRGNPRGIKPGKTEHPAEINADSQTKEGANAEGNQDQRREKRRRPFRRFPKASPAQDGTAPRRPPIKPLGKPIPVATPEAAAIETPTQQASTAEGDKTTSGQ